MSQEAITSPYVDFKYYQNEYGGNKIPQDSFQRLERQSEAVLHLITFDRVKRFPEITDAIRDAICAMAETAWLEEKKTPGVKSETIDGYSVSYADSGNTTGANGMTNAMYESAFPYLANTGLLFKGRSRTYDNEQ